MVDNSKSKAVSDVKPRNYIEGMITLFPAKTTTWNWSNLSDKTEISPRFIAAHPDCPWDWNRVSSHPDLTIDVLVEFEGVPWNWSIVSGHPNITGDMILANPQLPWE